MGERVVDVGEVVLPFTHALIRLGSGRYVQVSNDRRRVWVLYSYREDGSVTRASGFEDRGTYWAVSSLPLDHPALVRDGRGLVDQFDVAALAEGDWILSEGDVVRMLPRLADARERLGQIHARCSPLTFRQAAQLVVMTPDTFGAAMSREAKAGRDYRLPEGDWVDGRSPLYDAEALLTWNARRQRKPRRSESTKPAKGAV